jgi:hypothetical protein
LRLLRIIKRELKGRSLLIGTKPLVMLVHSSPR